VRGKDGVGAKMDSMDLEREKGITIQSAATFCRWKGTDINIIDTPGHVDFTIEVERALRVLDGAVLVLCGVGGVQSQSVTVDRQMRRYGVPRLAFINKLDRPGADPARVVAALRSKLKLNAAPVVVPIGLEAEHAGVVDLVRRVALSFDGPRGETVTEGPVPDALAPAVDAARIALIEAVADADDELAEAYLAGGEEDVGAAALAAAIRRATVGLAFVPVFMGSAYKNRGVQHLLDGVAAYLPGPGDVANTALDLDAAAKAEADAAKGGAPAAAPDPPSVPLPSDPAGPLVALAFKLEEGRFGQLTYLRIYSGTLRKGDTVTNVSTGKKVKVPRLVRMHAADMVDIAAAAAGDIVALFGVECASGDTFTDGSVRVALESMTVPDPVMSLAVSPASRDATANFSKALARFQREDPTFRVASDAETGQTLISGMGELHLEIYVARLEREYGVSVDVGRPRVNYREAVTRRADFDHLHKKQSGGAGQYARVVGYIEPTHGGDPGAPGGGGAVFARETVGNAVPPAFLPAVEKGFREAAASGALTGHPVDGVRFAITDGAAHAVDSSELAFKIAAAHAFRDAYAAAGPVVLEPVMAVEVRAPAEFQGAVVGDLNRRKGVVSASDADGDDVVLAASVPLSAMFGYSTALRSMTQGKGEFAMAYARHAPVPADAQATLTAEFKRARSG
jgi:elongation factor G